MLNHLKCHHFTGDVVTNNDQKLKLELWRELGRRELGQLVEEGEDCLGDLLVVKVVHLHLFTSFINHITHTSTGFLVNPEHHVTFTQFVIRLAECDWIETFGYDRAEDLEGVSVEELEGVGRVLGGGEQADVVESEEEHLWVFIEVLNQVDKSLVEVVLVC